MMMMTTMMMMLTMKSRSYLYYKVIEVCTARIVVIESLFL